jgi:hypothetical protein
MDRKGPEIRLRNRTPQRREGAEAVTMIEVRGEHDNLTVLISNAEVEILDAGED